MMTTKSAIEKLARIKRLVLILAVVVFVSLAISLIFIELNRSYSSLPANLEPKMTYEVVNTYPHDPMAFTQGLIYLDGFLYESTGLYGESSLRKVALESGEVLQQINLPSEYFGEGLTVWGSNLLQLTWREGTGFIYDLDSFTAQGQFTYQTEGWGLTHDGERIILSDGTSTLYFLDPENFQISGSVEVTYQGDPVTRINELEFIRGEVFANVWQTYWIIRIDPETGIVTGWIDMQNLLPHRERAAGANVLNGIAYDPEHDRLFVTGKLWPVLYEIRLVPVLSGE